MNDLLRSLGIDLDDSDKKVNKVKEITKKVKKN